MGRKVSIEDQAFIEEIEAEHARFREKFYIGICKTCKQLKEKVHRADDVCLDCTIKSLYAVKD